MYYLTWSYGDFKEVLGFSHFTLDPQGLSIHPKSQSLGLHERPTMLHLDLTTVHFNKD